MSQERMSGDGRDEDEKIDFFDKAFIRAIVLMTGGLLFNHLLAPRLPFMNQLLWSFWATIVVLVFLFAPLWKRSRFTKDDDVKPDDIALLKTAHIATATGVVGAGVIYTGLHFLLFA